MKKIAKISAFMAVILCAVILFAMSAFAGDIAIKTENTAEGIKVAWQKAEDVYYYELYRQCNDGSEEVLVSKSQTESFVDKETADGKLYGYRVVTVNSNEEKAEESDLSIIYRLGKAKISNYYSTDTGLYLEWSLHSDRKSVV